MSESPLTMATAQAVLALAGRLCGQRGRCGGDLRFGSSRRGERCENCPLDDVDGVHDALSTMAARPHGAA